MKLPAYLASHAQRRGDSEAVVCGAERVTFLDLHNQTDLLAGGLRHDGIGVGDRVAICLPNSVDFVRAFVGVVKAGAIAVPINVRLSGGEIDYVFTDCQPRAVFTTEAIWNNISMKSGVMPILSRIGIKSGIEKLIEQRITEVPDIPAEFDDCTISYTSGTTGKPKGAVLTQANYIVAHGLLNAVDWGLSSADRTLVTTPLAHRTGFARVINMLCLGQTVVIMPTFDSREAARLIQSESISVLGIVPTVGRMLLGEIETEPKKFDSLRIIVATGESFPIDVRQRIQDALPQTTIHSFFAMTEVGQISALAPEDQFDHSDSVGRPTVGAECKLVDSAGEIVDVGEAGEIWARSGRPGQYLTMRGYFNDIEATEQAIQNGWFATGDVGRFDKEGFLHIVDRTKDMILSGGYNIYSKEVESVIEELPGVISVAVVGVPDDVYGESVVAFIQVRDTGGPNSDQVIEHCRSRIASYKKPRYVYFVDEFPHTTVGKVKKDVLRRLAPEMIARVHDHENDSVS